MTNKETLDAIRQRLEHAGRIVVTAHMRPDGDAVGSVLALGLALQDQGKQVQMVLGDGVPSRFHFLTGSDQVEKKVKGQVDTVIVLDSGDLDRIGHIAQQVRKVDINIDHHPTNTDFGEINLVQPNAVSVTQMLAKIMPELGLEISLPIAEALLTGLVTDSQGFGTVNTTPEALRVAADLFKRGADLPEITFRGLTSKSYDSVRYWAAGLSKLERDGQMVWATLTNEDRTLSGYGGWDDADLVQLLNSIEEAQVAIVFIEQNVDKIKISWRAKAGFDVAEVAQQFGGGGHVPASGAVIRGKMDEVRQKVLQATKESLMKN